MTVVKLIFYLKKQQKFVWKKYDINTNIMHINLYVLCYIHRIQSDKLAAAVDKSNNLTSETLSHK